MTLETLNTLYKLHKSKVLFGRYITNSHIKKCLGKLRSCNFKVLGYSVKNQPIYNLIYGNGPIKILLWSQMHGNESTTTKALFDCINVFEAREEPVNLILKSCTLNIIPILNPDGAQSYTRYNANGVDLNRDAQQLSQPESKILRQLFDEISPNFCFNLHGQRTIFGAGNTGNSAILSFLAPSQDQLKTLTLNRKMAMAIIVGVHTLLQKEIPNKVGRYDDEFNLNCVGDTFQNLGVPTLLYEAGHYPKDYNREESRRLIFLSILKALGLISNGLDTLEYKQYFNIPQNEKCFYDIIIRNAKIDTYNRDIGIQYYENLVNNTIEFIPKIERITKLNNYFGHKELNAGNQIVKIPNTTELKIKNKIDFVSIKNEKITLKIK